MSASPPALPAAFLDRAIAHRGLHDRVHGRPENSRAAFSAAMAAGYGIELDVRSSADGVAMVFHDAALKRLTGRNEALGTLSAAALAAIPLSGGTEGIPTLSEILILVAGRAPLLIELKDRSGCCRGSDGVLERVVAAALVDYRGPVAVMSFNPDMIAQMAECAPRVARGLTTGAWHARDALRISPAHRRHLRAIADFDRTESSFISHQYTDLGRERVRRLRAEGVPVLCWTIRDSRSERRAREGADNITFEGYLPQGAPA